MIKDLRFLHNVHWLLLHGSNEGIPVTYWITTRNGMSLIG
jgi:hypothetical protein